MPRTKLAALLCGVVLVGCIYKKEPAPVIVGPTAVSRAEVAPVVSAVTVVAPSPAEPVLPEVPQSWLPQTKYERPWTAIVIHHSATSVGNAEIFDRWHREENQWDEVGYDFVIGNGSDSADGTVEVTFRWEQQRTGAHCAGTPDNWANEKAVGICLVGDFTQNRPTSAQLRALTRLVRFLQQRYGIPSERVYGHGTKPGARSTQCPGRLFPLAQFKATLSR
ncbi:MAG: N-acetylmuramoyl-L-alanine amidase [Phycisphaerales bacterium]|nr:MAG: N-acetylmuramoyl-L-alanine amidase [Phycisphaerales bacterium]